MVRVMVLTVISLFLFGSFYGQTAEFLDSNKEYKLAYEAEKKGDLEGALLHLENLIDSCEMDDISRFHFFQRVRDIRPKVKVGPKKIPQNTWTCLVLVYRNIDFEWTDKNGKKRHLVTKMSEQDIKAVRHGMDNFNKHVVEYSSRELQISYELKIIDRTLKTFNGDKAFWLSVEDMEKDMEGISDGAYDTVFGFTKFQQEKKGLAIPAQFSGGSLGADAGPKGCGYVNIILWANSLTFEARDGEIELHEWLHNIDWMFTALQGYPDIICPNPDHGRMEGDFGGDIDFRRSPDTKNWMLYYKHMMMDHVTRRMWQNASMHRLADTAWSKPEISEWLVLGPFEKTKGKTFSTAFIEEEKVRPLPKLQTSNKRWRVLSDQGKILNLDGIFTPNDNVVAYVHIYVYSDETQRAQVRIGSDDGAAVWHNGKKIYNAEVPRGLKIDENIVDVMLVRGWNGFLFKVDEIDGGWALSARFTNPDGKTLSGVRYSVKQD